MPVHRNGCPIADPHTASSLGEARTVTMSDKAGLPPELAVALEPGLRDLAVMPARSRVEPSDWGSVPEQITAMSRWPDGSGTGVYVLATDSPAQRIAMLADQVQDATVEALPYMGHPAVWPECPDHPDGHPLHAGCVDGAAVWTCPRAGRQIGETGRLGADR